MFVDYNEVGATHAVDTLRGTITFDPLRDQWTATVTVTEADLTGRQAAGPLSARLSARRVAVTPWDAPRRGKG